MAAAAISTAPKGYVPLIGSQIDELITQGFTISKISLQISSSPLVPKENKLVCYIKYTDQYTAAYNGCFDKNSCSAKLVEIFRELTERLKKGGSYADLTCNATIEATRKQAYGTFSNWTKEIRASLKGNLATPFWEKNLFGTFAAANGTPAAKK